MFLKVQYAAIITVKTNNRATIGSYGEDLGKMWMFAELVH